MTENLPKSKYELSVLLDPGTPQMQTIWFLLAKSGTLHAHLLQGIPARFAGGSYKVKEVNLQSEVLPEVTLPMAEQSPAAGVKERAEPELPAKWFSLKQGGKIIGEDPNSSVLWIRLGRWLPTTSPC